MPWQDRMTVEVEIEIEQQPTSAHLATVRANARRLTDDDSSIRVTQRPKGSRHVVVVRFGMPFQAQYKAVGDIALAFKMGILCEVAHVDMTIRFPRSD